MKICSQINELYLGLQAFTFVAQVIKYKKICLKWGYSCHLKNIKFIYPSIQMWYPNKNQFSSNKVINQYTQNCLIFRVTIECIPGFVLAPVSQRERHLALKNAIFQFLQLYSSKCHSNSSRCVRLACKCLCVWMSRRHFVVIHCYYFTKLCLNFRINLQQSCINYASDIQKLTTAIKIGK